MSDQFHQSARKILEDDLPVVRKSIMIGLGGSGMRGVGSARKYIESHMPNEARRYMRWVGIDTTDIGTSIEGEGGSYRFPGEKQFFQEETRTLYIGAPTPAELSTEYLRKLRREDPAYDWFPDPDVYTVSTRAGQGANQTRALGRLAFFANYERIRSALEGERDRLMALSNDPRFFKLMDVQEKSDVVTDNEVIRLEAHKDRYYIAQSMPEHHEIVSLKMDDRTRMVLSPHIPPEKVTASIFPRDDKGYYFEINPARAGVNEMHFQIRHAPREAAISIFLTGSVVGGTGNGMFLDMAALVHDIFREVWPKPKIYGIVVLPSAFKRVVYNRNARANAYAALKEIDYFMSGNAFRAIYPGGREVNIQNRLFDDGMLYLLDVENEAGNVLQDRDQVQELTGQFIYTFMASSAGGAIEERMVNDSSRTSIYYPEQGSEPRRRASYNSFGISRVTYPAPQLRDLGFNLVSLRLIHSFHKRPTPERLEEAFGDLNRGLVRALRLNCRLIFNRMYPDYKLDWQSEFNSYKVKIQKALGQKDPREMARVLELLHRDYGKGEADRLKDRMLARMESRWRIELDKMEQVLSLAVDKVTRDPGRGLIFMRALVEMVMDKLELYQNTYYEQRTGLEYYNGQEIEQLIADFDDGEWKPKKAEAVFYMVRTNHLQLIYESMLQASEEFTREFKSLLYRIKNETLAPLQDKLQTLARELQGEVQAAHFELLQKINPLFFYLVNKDEINRFINEHFAKRLSIDDLSNDVDFLHMDRADDARQLIETFLIGKHGLEILEKKPDEMEAFITQELGAEILDKDPEAVREQLYGGTGPEDPGLEITDSTMQRIEVENLRLGLYRIIHKRFDGFNFENFSIKKLLDERKIPVKKILERLDRFSRPYVTADLQGLKSMEYFRTISQFEINVFEEGDEAPAKSTNDLPARMDHYTKRAKARPNISVETFVVPNLAKPYEIISTGIVLGFPLFRLDSLRESAHDYHEILGDRSHPMHLFNTSSFDARYFPDPFRDRNYLNPKHLWDGLNKFELIKENEGRFVYAESLAERLRELEAREHYLGSVRKVIEKIEAAGGIRSCPGNLFTRAILALGLLKKNKNGSFRFRRDYDMVVRDIIDGDGTGDRGREAGLSKDEYIRKHIPSPIFESMQALSAFLQEHKSVRGFLERDLDRLFHDTMSHESAGAAVRIPAARVRATKLPEFRDDMDFYEYFEERGSLEWQNFLKDHLVEAVENTVRRFRKPEDPTLFDRGRIRNYLEEMGNQIPSIVAWEVMLNTGVIR